MKKKVKKEEKKKCFIYHKVDFYKEIIHVDSLKNDLRYMVMTRCNCPDELQLIIKVKSSLY